MKVKYFFQKSFWQNFWHSLSDIEKKIFWGALILMIGSLIIGGIFWYLNHTKLVAKEGGILVEGMVGQPTTINPLFAANEIDQSLSSLVYRGLLKSDGKGGIVNDLAESYEKSEDGRHWVVHLRKDVFWHDGIPFTADDVVFTINAIQNPDTRSPYRTAWQGVAVIKISDYTLTFDLKNPYAFFEENLKQKIIPKHIFGEIPLANMRDLSAYNFEPIGTGPFVYEKFDATKKGYINYYIFNANERFYNGRPFIDSYIIKFYQSEIEALKAFDYHQIDLLSNVAALNLRNINRSHQLYEYSLPQYFSVFLNASISKPLSDRNVRYALNYATNRKEIIDEVFQGRAEAVEGPILAWMPGYNPNLKSEYALDKAKQILASAGWEDADGDGTVEKILNKNESPTPLKITLITPSTDFLIQTASLLKKQWKEIGVEVEIKIVDPSDLQNNYLTTRLYDALLYGNIINQKPDLFSFWHSSQKFYPGLNLSLYENASVDRFLEDARLTASEEAYKKDLANIQSAILTDMPAIFLYNPRIILVAPTSLHIENLEKLNISSERYDNVYEWYLKTKRILVDSTD